MWFRDPGDGVRRESFARPVTIWKAGHAGTPVSCGIRGPSCLDGCCSDNGRYVAVWNCDIVLILSDIVRYKFRFEVSRLWRTPHLKCIQASYVYSKQPWELFEWLRSILS